MKVILIIYVEERDRSYKLTQGTQDDTSRHKLTNSFLNIMVGLLLLSFAFDLHFISKTLNLAANIYFIDVNRNSLPAHRETDKKSNLTSIP